MEVFSDTWYVATLVYSCCYIVHTLLLLLQKRSTKKPQYFPDNLQFMKNTRSVKYTQKYNAVYHDDLFTSRELQAYLCCSE